MSVGAAVERAAAARDWAVRSLSAAGIAPEALAEFVPAGKRLLIFPRAATMRPIGEVWRLGRLLLGTSGDLFALGTATRAAERGRVGYQSLTREARKDIAAAALHGGYPIGTPVNFNAAPLPLTEDALGQLGTDAPIGVADGEVRVRWRDGATLAGAPTLAAYLAERVELLINPPFGRN